MTDQITLKVEIRFAAIKAELEGMIVANEKRRAAGKSPIYTQASFEAVAREMRALANTEGLAA